MGVAVAVGVGVGVNVDVGVGVLVAVGVGVPVDVGVGVGVGASRTVSFTFIELPRGNGLDEISSKSKIWLLLLLAWHSSSVRLDQSGVENVLEPIFRLANSEGFRQESSLNSILSCDSSHLR